MTRVGVDGGGWRAGTVDECMVRCEDLFQNEPSRVMPPCCSPVWLT